MLSVNDFPFAELGILTSSLVLTDPEVEDRSHFDDLASQVGDPGMQIPEVGDSGLGSAGSRAPRPVRSPGSGVRSGFERPDPDQFWTS